MTIDFPPRHQQFIRSFILYLNYSFNLSPLKVLQRALGSTFTLVIKDILQLLMHVMSALDANATGVVGASERTHKVIARLLRDAVYVNDMDKKIVFAQNFIKYVRWLKLQCGT